MPTRKAKKTTKSKAVKGKAGKAKAKAAPGKCSGWKAVLNMMPPGPSVLRVTGKCLFPTHGYKVTLKEAVPQGINPAILLLRKTVTPPTFRDSDASGGEGYLHEENENEIQQSHDSA